MTGLLLFLIVTGLPDFYSVFQSQGAQKLVFASETASGYIVVGSLQQSWGGASAAVVYTTDQHGAVMSQTFSTASGEPVDASELQNGVVVVCNAAAEGVTSVVFFSNSGEEQWLAQYSPDFFQNVAVCSSGANTVVAGNVSGVVRVSKLNSSGGVAWNRGYPSAGFSVSCVCTYNGEIFVVGSREDSGWNSSLCILSLNSAGELQQLYNLFPGEGRILPVALEVDSRGLFILINAMTDANNMIGETRFVKLNSALQHQWTVVAAGRSWETGTGLAALPGGDFAVCGWTNSIPFSESNRSDLCIRRFSDSGELLWTRKHSTVRSDYGLSVSSASDGGLIVSGCVTETLYQGWLLKTDSLGCVGSQGVEESPGGEFRAVLLANPVVSGFLSFVLNCTEPGIVEVTVYDTAGRSVAMFTTSVVTGENLLNLSACIPAGVYCVAVSNSTDQLVFRAVVCGGM